jgi:hypothetical protein
MPAAGIQYPITDHLWQLGFNLKTLASPLPIVIGDEEGNQFFTQFELMAYPERGEARRHFSRKGPCRAEVKSNYAVDYFRLKDSMLTAIYTEKCAAILLEMLTREVPTLSQPRDGVAA